MSLSSRSTKRPVAVAMFFLAVVLLGLISFQRLPIDLLPDIAYPRLVIYTSYPDVAPREVERFVTEIVEQNVSAVPNVERVESVSRDGISLVTLRFAWGTDMDFAVLNVRERLDNIRDQLPELAERPVVLRTDPTSEPVMALSVSGREDLWALKELAQEVFKRRLEQIDGVAQAAVVGGLEREIHVEVDPRLLQAYGIDIDQVLTALDAANQSAPGGTIRRGRYRYALRTIGEFQTVEEIAAVPLTRGDTVSVSGSVRLRDVARVVDGFKDRESIARYNGSEAVGLLLFKDSGANTVRVADQVEEVLSQLRAEYPEIRLDIAMSQADFIGDAISSVVQALLVGGLLAFLVLFLFLRDARYPVAIALAIPISVIASFALLDLAGVSLNIMSLGGLALGVGMLVDNSIVVLENVFRHREMGKSPMAAAAAGAEEVQGAITASTITTISVFGPIIYVEGVAGQLFGALSFAVAFALIASLIVALSLLPMMAARWKGDGSAGPLSPPLVQPQEPAIEGRLAWARRIGRGLTHAVVGLGSAVTGVARRTTDGISNRVRAAASPFLDAFDRAFMRFANWYHRLLERALDHRGRVVALSAGILLGGIAVGATLDRGVLPDVDQGSFQVRLRLERGSPIEQTSAAAARLESAFAANPGVVAIFTRVGRQEAIAGIEEEESGLNTASLDVRLVADARTARVVEDLSGVFAGFPAGVLTVETGQATALGRLLGGGEADLAVRIRGDDLDEAFAYAQLVAQRLSEVSTLTNVRLSTEEGQPEVLIDVDRERAAAYGIDPSAIAETVERYMRGSVPTEYVDFDQKIPILVRLPEAERRSLATLELLEVEGVPLRDLVHTRETVGPAEVRRLEQSRMVAVYADVASGGLDGALADVAAAIAENPAPRGLRVDVGGENEERAESFRELAFAFALALILVYMILAAQFESFVHPFTILLSVPLATVGAAVALWVAGAGLNTMSLIGIVILVGIVVNDAIVKVDFINRMRRQGLVLRQAILEAGRVRLRPIVMTTVTTVLGLMPMALGLGRGSDLRAPLAVAVIGGLLSATALTLVVVPVAYDLIEEGRVKLRAMVGLAGAPRSEEPIVGQPDGTSSRARGGGDS
ncbi:MAG: efflux RND transporter permease subunit [Gemmatimonadetes bacterium]|nr:efflux RND transporter permease subunit [Gemmatimonadota bacterium]